MSLSVNERTRLACPWLCMVVPPTWMLVRKIVAIQDHIQQLTECCLFVLQVKVLYPYVKPCVKRRLTVFLAFACPISRVCWLSDFDQSSCCFSRFQAKTETILASTLSCLAILAPQAWPHAYIGWSSASDKVPFSFLCPITVPSHSICHYHWPRSSF